MQPCSFNYLRPQLSENGCAHFAGHEISQNKNRHPTASFSSSFWGESGGEKNGNDNLLTEEETLSSF